jgi:citrate synthase
MATATVVKGLEGVVAANSGICWIDGYAGVLAYRGIDIHELAEKSTFEETTYLLWHGHLPDRSELQEFSRKLTEARRVPPQIYDLLRSFPKTATPMEALRTAVSALSPYDPDEAAVDHDSNVRKAFALTAQLPMIVAAYDRIRKGKDIVQPDPSLKHAANFLWMLHGKKPIPAAERTFDIALILHADHELNASTFAARVIAGSR